MTEKGFGKLTPDTPLFVKDISSHQWYEAAVEKVLDNVAVPAVHIRITDPDAPEFDRARFHKYWLWDANVLAYR